MAALKDSPEKASGSAASSSAATLDASLFVSQHGRDDNLLQTIDRLKKQQAEHAAAKKKVATELRNCKKRKMRIVHKAKELTNEDLVEVLRFRAKGGDKQAEPLAADSQQSETNGESASPVEDQQGDTGA